jgi:hypothetical protein
LPTGSLSSVSTRASLFADLRIWNVVRTAQEIMGNYAVELGGIGAGLVANWSFDEPSGPVAHDATGHGHDGHLQAGASFSNDVHH